MLAILLLGASLCRADDDELTLDGAAPVAEAAPAPVAGPIAAATPLQELDRMFQAYAACYGLDWRVLKVFAEKESRLYPWKNEGNPRAYQGLFQFNQAACEASLNDFRALGMDCSDLIDPELNTAAATERFHGYAKLVRNKCGAPSDAAGAVDAMSLIYVGHNNGIGVLGFVLRKNGCAGADPDGGAPSGQEEAVRGWYLPSENPKAKTDKLIKNYAERNDCRTWNQKEEHKGTARPDDCFVKVKKACLGKRQLELYTRGAALEKAQLSDECAPTDGDSEFAEVGVFAGVDEGWGAEKWLVGRHAAQKAVARYDLKSLYPAGAQDDKLCPLKLGGRLFKKEELETVFPKDPELYGAAKKKVPKKRRR
jgi:hypothetical protein